MKKLTHEEKQKRLEEFHRAVRELELRIKEIGTCIEEVHHNLGKFILRQWKLLKKDINQ